MLQSGSDLDWNEQLHVEQEADSQHTTDKTEEQSVKNVE